MLRIGVLELKAAHDAGLPEEKLFHLTEQACFQGAPSDMLSTF